MAGKQTETMDKTYQFWRNKLMLSMIIGYATFYLTRKSFNFVMPVMQTELHLDKSDIGLIATAFYLSYGLSKFVSGIFHDITGYRWFMGAGLFMTGVLNIVFAWCLSFPALLIVWTLNGFFQGWGWPPCARILTHWYSRNERGFWWGLWNISINLSGIADRLAGDPLQLADCPDSPRYYRDGHRPVAVRPVARHAAGGRITVCRTMAA